MYAYITDFNSMIAWSQEAIGDEDIVRSLFKGMEKEKESLSYAKLSAAMFDAAKYGNIMILKFIFKYYPDLLFEVDSTKQRNLLHIAILHRQEAVYKLILKQGDFKNLMVQLVDFKGNNVLHLAAKLDEPEHKFGLSTNYVQMRTEETWFQVYMWHFSITDMFIYLIFFFLPIPVPYNLFMVKTKPAIMISLLL